VGSPTFLAIAELQFIILPFGATDRNGRGYDAPQER
jgi:hypothetical protein